MNLQQAVDLHCHSNYSDGKLSPAEVSELMYKKGVEFFSLTDHDTTAGCVKAKEAADCLGLKFIPGVEISSRHIDKSLHILGLNIDESNCELQDFLATNRDIRRDRQQKTLDRLSHFGINIKEDLEKFSTNHSPGRSHFAEALVRNKYAENKSEAFRKYLLKGGAAYVNTLWPDMKKVIDKIHLAGGQAVLAHPNRYGYSLPGLRSLFRQFRDAGGDGAEVSSGPQALGVVQRLSQLCSKFGLKVSGGSDFHDPESPWVKAGEYQQIPKRLKRIWQEMDWYANP